METMEALKTGLHSPRTSNNNFLRKLVILMGAIGVALFFVPVMQVCVQNERNSFCLSFFQILTSNKFSLFFDSSVAHFNFSIFTKCCVAASFALIPIAAIFNLFKKYNASAILFFLTGCCPLNILPTIGSLKNQFLNLQISSNRIFIGLLWPFFLLTLVCFTCCAVALATISVEHLAKTFFLCLSFSILFCLALLTSQMLFESTAAFQQIGFLNLLTKSEWNPALNNFGILNLIKTSVVATLSALLISAPVGVLTAVFMVEMCSKQVLKILSTLIDLMAGIPSVVFGFFGMSTIVPAIKKIFYSFQTSSGNPVVGDSLLAVVLVLIMMILPTIVNTSIVALKAVPRQFKEASFGLGANKIETIFKVCVPAAKTAIVSGLVLAFGRAIGETMAVIMVAGNIVNPPELLGTVRLLTTGIAIDIGYASGLLKSVLFFMGLVLLILITIVNLLFKFSFLINHNNNSPAKK